MLHEKEICFTLKGIYLRRAFLNDVSPLWYQVRIYYEISILAPPPTPASGSRPSVFCTALASITTLKIPSQKLPRAASSAELPKVSLPLSFF